MNSFSENNASGSPGKPSGINIGNCEAKHQTDAIITQSKMTEMISGCTGGTNIAGFDALPLGAVLPCDCVNFRFAGLVAVVHWIVQWLIWVWVLRKHS